MAKQRLVIDSDERGHFFLSVQDGTLKVGADAPNADIVLGDLRVVRIHCEVEVDEGSIAIRGDPDHELHPGETCHVRHSHLRLIEVPAPAEAAKQPARAPGSSPEITATANPATVNPATANPATATQPCLTKRLFVIDGADHGHSYAVPEAGVVTIGNSRKHADIVLHDLYVARVHCELHVDEGRVRVTHKEGARGTLINGQRITEQELNLGDILRVGNSHLRYEIGVPDPRAAAETLDDLGTFAVAPAAGGIVARKSAPTATSTSGTLPAPSPAADDPLSKLEGQALGQYQFGALLGRGLSGLVFRAHHRQTNQPVTVKVLSSDFPNNDAEQQNFIKALKVIAPLRHPHLVTLYAAGRTGPYCWIAREYVEGESLATMIGRLQAEGKLGWTRACRVALHLGKVLEFLHEHRVTHGNLTPPNVLVDSNTKATKLADLMLDKALSGSRLHETIQEKKLLAELPYRAPEQTEEGAVVDQRADIYSVGALVYALLTGQPPFTGFSPNEIIGNMREAKLVRPSKFLRDTPPPFEAAVLTMMARRPEDRYQTAGDLLAVIEPIANMHEIAV